MPRGWIAGDYIAAPGSCPSSNGKSDTSAYAAVIVRYSTLPPGAILTVCADQHMPYDWTREPEQETDAGSTQCPRMAGDTRTGPNIVRIRRNEH